MSVIHFNAKELGLIASVAISGSNSGVQKQFRDEIFMMVTDLGIANSKAYSVTYGELVNEWTTKQIEHYYKFDVTRNDRIEALESILSLRYNCISNDGVNFLDANPYIRGAFYRIHSLICRSVINKVKGV